MAIKTPHLTKYDSDYKQLAAEDAKLKDEERDLSDRLNEYAGVMRLSVSSSSSAAVIR